LPQSVFTDLNESLSQLVRSMRSMYQEKTVELSSTIPEHVLLDMAEEHIVSITQNLLSNALKHTRVVDRSNFW